MKRADIAAKIRPVRPSDAADITDIYAHAVLHGTGTFDITPPGIGEVRERIEMLIRDGFPYLVGMRNGAVAGYAYAAPFRARAAFAGTLEDSVYVAECHRGSGLGRMLLAALVECCEAKGFRQLLALIGDQENEASIALHRGLGFEHRGTLAQVGFKHGRWLDVVVMQRALTLPLRKP